MIFASRPPSILAMDHDNHFNSTTTTATATTATAPSTTTTPKRQSHATPVGYIVTGRAAHGRVARLFRQLLARHLPPSQHRRWVDLSPYASAGDSSPLGECADGTGSGIWNDDGDADATIQMDYDCHNNDDNRHRNSHDDRDRVDHPADNDHPHPIPVAFLWENAPRSCTRPIRDDVLVYSHLPNGIQLLDDKWALARLLSPTANRPRRGHFVALESHCFRGREFAAFAERVGLTEEETEADATTRDGRFEDLTDPSSPSSLRPPPPPHPKNLWVVKDASSNGAGGIWIADPTNARRFASPGPSAATTTTMLHPDRRYVAQRYAWPPVLYDGRKCHVRVYGLLAADGRAYVHRRAFLHVANDPFDHRSPEGGESSFEASVHITNCCANSHDVDKFAGEICVDLGAPGPFSKAGAGDADGDDANDDARFDPDQADIPLGDYLPSIAASLAALAERSAPFLRGGEANSGFEYLGLDFVLSSVPDDDGDDDVTTTAARDVERIQPHRRHRRTPVAYLLEVNCPPSQDTATGLARAEKVHDEVISDLLRRMVLPRLGICGDGGEEEDEEKEGAECDGWKCVYAPPPPPAHPSNRGKETVPIAPSKAAIVNRIRWAMFERRAAREYEAGGKEETRTAVDRCESSSDPMERRSRRKCEENGGLPTEERRSPRDDDDDDAALDSSFVRSRFPYFATNPDDIFFESGGGSQVPDAVANAVHAALSHRDRSVVGATCLRRARRAVASLLMGRPSSTPRNEKEENDDDDEDDDRLVMMGSNATSLLDLLARKYCESGVLAPGDEIVVASENHLAHVHPWLRAAETSGCQVKWWTLTDTNETHPDENNNSNTNVSTPSSPSESSLLSELVTDRTRIVAVSHASNILGGIRDIASVCSFVHAATNGYGRVVVDGVAAAPHWLSKSVFLDGTTSPDWYVVSLHKMYGPHLGCLLGKRDAAAELSPATSISTSLSSRKDVAATTLEIYKSWELGTANYEACAGACALEEYFRILSNHVSVGERSHSDWQPTNERTGESSIDDDYRQREAVPPTEGNGEVSSTVDAARTWIRTVEDRLIRRLLGYLRNCAPDVRIIEDVKEMKITPTQHSNVENTRLPIVSFVHARIPSRDIVQHCRKNGIICRSCKFLSTERLWRELSIEDEGVVRFSLAHYNTLDEVDRTIRALESLDDWTML